MSSVQVVALYLPQFHPIPENDQWWGAGFTEWTNVKKASALFPGHRQPQVPGTLGYYDLNSDETRMAQAELAKSHGIDAFCYYHYWFNGKQLMERPVKEILSSGKPDFPFMLCWANENWTRAWDGRNDEILIRQQYNKQDDIDHMRYLCERVFNDPRYIRVYGKPFFVVYRPYWIPNVKETVKTWRDIATSYGIELYLGFMQSGNIEKQFFFDAGFDTAIDFQPHTSYTNAKRKKWWLDINIYKNLFYTIILRKPPPIKPAIFDYAEYVESMIEKDFCPKQFPGITPGWDNSPRKKDNNFFSFTNNTPILYGKWLHHLVKEFTPPSPEENFIFINAWNEWGEGNHLEPDQKWGSAFLEETLKQSSL